jgi:ABC-2 type transport system permease protein
MLQLLRDILKNWELIWALALKELRVRYKRSALGFLWALLNPLMMMVILTVVFSTIASMPVDKYAVFLISALMPWTFFSQALSYSVESIVGNGVLLQKVRVTQSVFPVAAVVSNLLNFFFSLGPMILILLVLRFPLHWTWAFLPVPLFALFCFTLGCGFFCAAANVFYRDVSHVIQIVLQGWFYLSPVMYSLEFLPGKYRGFFKLNPMLYLLDEFRVPIYYGQIPSVASIALSMGIGLVSLYIGYMVFRRVKDSFVFYV